LAADDFVASGCRGNSLTLNFPAGEQPTAEIDWQPRAGASRDVSGGSVASHNSIDEQLVSIFASGEAKFYTGGSGTNYWVNIDSDVTVNFEIEQADRKDGNESGGRADAVPTRIVPQVEFTLSVSDDYDGSDNSFYSDGVDLLNAQTPAYTDSDGYSPLKIVAGDQPGRMMGLIIPRAVVKEDVEVYSDNEGLRVLNVVMVPSTVDGCASSAPVNGDWYLFIA